MENWVSVKDIEWEVGDRCIICGYERGSFNRHGFVSEYKCLEKSPIGCVKVLNMVSNEIKWYLPTDTFNIYEIITEKKSRKS